MASKRGIAAPKPEIETFPAENDTSYLKLREALSNRTIFGRSDVIRAIDIKSSEVSELLREMAERGIIEPIAGYGKGKYRFRQ